MFKKVYLFVALISIAGSCFAFNVPVASGHVNDYAKLLSKDVVVSLEEKLQNYETATTRQFVILTVNDMDGKTVEEYAILVANKWKLGEKKENNGLLLLIAKKERKIRIEVGKGIEDEYTDVFTGRVIDDILTPYLKKGDFDQGVIKAIDALISEVKATVDPDDGSYIILVVFGIIILLILLAIFNDDGAGSSGGGYIGGGRSSGNWSSSGSSRSSGGGSSGGGSGFSGRGGGFSGGGSSGSF